MIRYYFHIRDGWTVIRDEEGLECRDLEAAKIEAYFSARDLTGSWHCGACAVEIQDHAGNVLASVKVPNAA